MTKRLILTGVMLCGLLCAGIAEARVCFLGEEGCESLGNIGADEMSCPAIYKGCTNPRAGAPYCGQQVGDHTIALYKEEDCCATLPYKECPEDLNEIGYGKSCRGSKTNITYYEFCGCGYGFVDTEPEGSTVGSIEEEIKDEEGHLLPYEARCSYDNRYPGKCKLAVCNDERRFFALNSGDHCVYRAKTRCGALGCEQLYDCNNADNYFRSEELELKYYPNKAKHPNDYVKIDNYIEYSEDDPWSNEKDKDKQNYIAGVGGDREYKFYKPAGSLPYGKKISDYDDNNNFRYEEYNVTNRLVCSYKNNSGTGADLSGGLDCNGIENYCYQWTGCNQVRGWYPNNLNMGVLYGETNLVFADYADPGAYEHWMNEVERDPAYNYRLGMLLLSPASAIGESLDLHNQNNQLRENFFREVGNPGANKYNESTGDNNLPTTRSNCGIAGSSCEITNPNAGCTYVTHACHRGDNNCYKRISCSEENRFYHSFINAAATAFNDAGGTITIPNIINTPDRPNHNVLYNTSLNGIYWMDFYKAADGNGPAGLADNEIYPACIYEINACNDTTREGLYGGGCYRKSLTRGCIDNFEDIRNHLLLEQDWLNWFKDWRPICNDNTRCYQASACDLVGGSYSSSPNTSFFNTIHSTATMSTCYRGANCSFDAGAYSSIPNVSFFYVIESQATGSICYRGQNCNFAAGAYSSKPNTSFFMTNDSTATGSICYRGEDCRYEVGAYSSSPNTSFFITIDSKASGSTCYRGLDCNFEIGTYSSTPNTSFFTTIHSEASNTICYRGEQCWAQVGSYSSTPNTSFFNTISSEATSSNCYRGDRCNYEGGTYNFAPNATFFTNITSEASGSTCYRAQCCTPPNCELEKPDTSFFYAIYSEASDFHTDIACYRAPGCNEPVGAYTSSPNTAFFNTVTSLFGAACQNARGICPGFDPSTTSSHCYRAKGCDFEKGAYSSNPSTSFFITIQSQASGSECYRGEKCNLAAGSYSSSPNILFFKDPAKSIASGSECYRGEDCNYKKGAYSSTPNTSFFVTAQSKASGSECYRGEDCATAKVGAYNFTPSTAFFKVITSEATGTTCYRGEECNFAEGAYTFALNAAFFTVIDSHASGSLCYRAQCCTPPNCELEEPDTSFFYAIYSEASHFHTDLACYRAPGCNISIGAYTSTPNTSFFSTVTSLFGAACQNARGVCPGFDPSKTSSHCYRAEGCHFAKGAYSSKPNTSFFIAIKSNASGSDCYRGQKCNAEAGAYSSSPNTSFFLEPIKSIASGFTCYRKNEGKICNNDAGSYLAEEGGDDLNTSYFYVIRSIASGTECYRVSRCHREAGAYSSSPNTSFFNPTTSLKSWRSVCYRAHGCNYDAGARILKQAIDDGDINTSYFLLINSEATGSTCYRGDRCDPAVGSYSVVPNTSFFITSHSVSPSPVNTTCYRGEACRVEQGVYTSIPNTSFFNISTSKASGSTCYRVKDCKYPDRANEGPCRAYPDTAYFEVEYATMVNTTCTRPTGCKIDNINLPSSGYNLFEWKTDTWEGIECPYIFKPRQGYQDVNYCIFNRATVPAPELIDGKWVLTKGQRTARDTKRVPECTQVYANSGDFSRDECGNILPESNAEISVYVPLSCNEANGWSSDADKLQSCYFNATSVTMHGYMLNPTPSMQTSIEQGYNLVENDITCYKYTEPKWSRSSFTNCAYTWTSLTSTSHSSHPTNSVSNGFGGRTDTMESCSNTTKGGAMANKTNIGCGDYHRVLQTWYPTGCDNSNGWYPYTTTSTTPQGVIGSDQLNVQFFYYRYTATSNSHLGTECFNVACYQAKEPKCNASSSIFNVTTVAVRGGPICPTSDIKASYATGCNTGNGYYPNVGTSDDPTKPLIDSETLNASFFQYAQTSITKDKNCGYSQDVTCYYATSCAEPNHPNWCKIKNVANNGISCSIDDGCKDAANTQYFVVTTKNCEQGTPNICTNRVAIAPKCSVGDETIWKWSSTSTTDSIAKDRATNYTAVYPVGCQTGNDYYKTSDVSSCSSSYFSFGAATSTTGCGHTVACKKYEGCVQSPNTCIVTTKDVACQGNYCTVADKCKKVPDSGYFYTTSITDSGLTCTMARGSKCYQTRPDIFTYNQVAEVSCSSEYASLYTYSAWNPVGCNSNYGYYTTSLAMSYYSDGYAFDSPMSATGCKGTTMYCRRFTGCINSDEPNHYFLYTDTSSYIYVPNTGKTTYCKFNCKPYSGTWAETYFNSTSLTSKGITCEVANSPKCANPGSDLFKWTSTSVTASTSDSNSGIATGGSNLTSWYITGCKNTKKPSTYFEYETISPEGGDADCNPNNVGGDCFKVTGCAEGYYESCPTGTHGVASNTYDGLQCHVCIPDRQINDLRVFMETEYESSETEGEKLYVTGLSYTAILKNSQNPSEVIPTQNVTFADQDPFTITTTIKVPDGEKTGPNGKMTTGGSGELEEGDKKKVCEKSVTAEGAIEYKCWPDVSSTCGAKMGSKNVLLRVDYDGQTIESTIYAYQKLSCELNKPDNCEALGLYDDDECEGDKVPVEVPTPIGPCYNCADPEPTLECPTYYGEGDAPDSNWFVYNTTSIGSAGKSITCYRVTGCKNTKGAYDDEPGSGFEYTHSSYTRFGESDMDCYKVTGCADPYQESKCEGEEIDLVNYHNKLKCYNCGNTCSTLYPEGEWSSSKPTEEENFYFKFKETSLTTSDGTVTCYRATGCQSYTQTSAPGAPLYCSRKRSGKTCYVTVPDKLTINSGSKSYSWSGGSLTNTSYFDITTIYGYTSISGSQKTYSSNLKEKISIHCPGYEMEDSDYLLATPTSAGLTTWNVTGKACPFSSDYNKNKKDAVFAVQDDELWGSVDMPDPNDASVYLVDFEVHVGDENICDILEAPLTVGECSMSCEKIGLKSEHPCEGNDDAIVEKEQCGNPITCYDESKCDKKCSNYDTDTKHYFESCPPNAVPVKATSITDMTCYECKECNSGFFYYENGLSNPNIDTSVYTYDVQKPSSSIYKQCLKPTCNLTYYPDPKGNDDVLVNVPAYFDTDPNAELAEVIETKDTIAIFNNLTCYKSKWPTHLVLYYDYLDSNTTRNTGDFEIKPGLGKLYRGTEDVTDRFDFVASPDVPGYQGGVTLQKLKTLSNNKGTEGTAVTYNYFLDLTADNDAIMATYKTTSVSASCSTSDACLDTYAKTFSYAWKDNIGSATLNDKVENENIPINIFYTESNCSGASCEHKLGTFSTEAEVEPGDGTKYTYANIYKLAGRDNYTYKFIDRNNATAGEYTVPDAQFTYYMMCIDGGCGNPVKICHNYNYYYYYEVEDKEANGYVCEQVEGDSRIGDEVCFNCVKGNCEEYSSERNYMNECPAGDCEEWTHDKDSNIPEGLTCYEKKCENFNKTYVATCDTNTYPIQVWPDQVGGLTCYNQCKKCSDYDSSYKSDNKSCPTGTEPVKVDEGVDGLDCYMCPVSCESQGGIKKTNRTKAQETFFAWEEITDTEDCYKPIGCNTAYGFFEDSSKEITETLNGTTCGVNWPAELYVYNQTVTLKDKDGTELKTAVVASDGSTTDEGIYRITSMTGYIAKSGSAITISKPVSVYKYTGATIKCTDNATVLGHSNFTNINLAKWNTNKAPMKCPTGHDSYIYGRENSTSEFNTEIWGSKNIDDSHKYAVKMQLIHKDGTVLKSTSKTICINGCEALRCEEGWTNEKPSSEIFEYEQTTVESAGSELTCYKATGCASPYQHEECEGSTDSTESNDFECHKCPSSECGEGYFDYSDRPDIYTQWSDEKEFETTDSTTDSDRAKTIYHYKRQKDKKFCLQPTCRTMAPYKFIPDPFNRIDDNNLTLIHSVPADSPHADSSRPINESTNDSINNADTIAIAKGVICHETKWPTHVVIEYRYNDVMRQCIEKWEQCIKNANTHEQIIKCGNCYNSYPGNYNRGLVELTGKAFLYRGKEDVTDRFEFKSVVRTGSGLNSRVSRILRVTREASKGPSSSESEGSHEDYNLLITNSGSGPLSVEFENDDARTYASNFEYAWATQHDVGCTTYDPHEEVRDVQIDMDQNANEGSNIYSNDENNRTSGYRFTCKWGSCATTFTTNYVLSDPNKDIYYQFKDNTTGDGYVDFDSTSLGWLRFDLRAISARGPDGSSYGVFVCNDPDNGHYYLDNPPTVDPESYAPITHSEYTEIPPGRVCYASCVDQLGDEYRVEEPGEKCDDLPEYGQDWWPKGLRCCLIE